MQNNPNHGNTSMQKHLLNEHLNNFGTYKVKLEFGEGGVGGRGGGGYMNKNKKLYKVKPLTNT
jgi:hypothetical protein